MACMCGAEMVAPHPMPCGASAYETAAARGGTNAPRSTAPKAATSAGVRSNPADTSAAVRSAWHPAEHVHAILWSRGG